MNKGKQATLFQSWGSNAKKKTSTCTSGSAATSNQVAEVIDLSDIDDEDDELLACALNESLGAQGCQTENDDHEEENLGNISLGADYLSSTQVQSQLGQTGFDKVAGKLWIYPTNYPVRDYQYNIVQQALFKNTMVTLPTGLGKTFIASVVMFNYYRWYPQGKIVFMAPTKPLVAQQIEACYNIMGIPQEHTAEMTGSMPPQERRRAWEEKRVFFLTPQVLTNDLSRGTCPAQQVKCVVVDEAHKALGNHAYCQVVRELMNYSNEFRVLALSATPGSDIKAVQQVLSNLLISHIELRTEDSIDIKQYSFNRQVDKIIVPFSQELTEVKNRYIKIMDVIVGKLKRYGVIYNREVTSLSKFVLLKSREAFRQNPPHRLPRTQYGMVEGDFALAISLYHGYELVQLHGLRSLYNFLDGAMKGDKGHGRTKTELMKIPDFGDLMNMLHEKFGKMNGQENAQAINLGHPKLAKLEEVVLDHFKSVEGSGKEQNEQTTRIMIFSQYRDSVEEITNMLRRHEPKVKAMSFIGQSSAGKATKGFTQKEQLKVMKKFREGRYNTLVATCVGEEGLDIGEVDLIICYDASKSPIRLVQRMGRTGRKRQGRIVMLVTQGKEEQIYNQGIYSKKSIHKAILNSAKTLQFYQSNPRMIPEGVEPKSHKMFITVKQAFKPNKEIILDSQPPPKSTKSKTLKNSRGSDGGLTLDELTEVEGLMSMGKPLPKASGFLALGEGSEDTEGPPDTDALSYNSWMPWQNSLQSEHQISHSNRTRHFVDVVKFIELQNCVDENSYEEEMRLYLDPGDIITSKKKKPTIQQYCSEKNSSTIQESRRSRVRRSEQLPQFESIQEESDDDLPQVPFRTAQNSDVEKDGVKYPQPKNDKEMCEAAEEIIGNQKDEENFPSVLLTEDLAEAQAKNRIRRRSEVKGKRKSSLTGRNSLLPNSRKKRSLPSANSSIVSIIADNDESDFEGVNISENTMSDTIQCDTSNSAKKPLKTILETYGKVVNKITASNSSVLQTVPEIISIDDEMEVLDNVASDAENRGDEVDCFTEPNNKCDEPDTPMSPVSTDSEAFSIPEAPSLDDLEDLIHSLGDAPIFPVDLLRVVDEWENRYLPSKIVNDIDQCKVSSRLLSDIKCFDTGISDSARENVITNDDFSKSSDADENHSSDVEKRQPVESNQSEENDDLTERKLENGASNVISEIEVHQESEPVVNQLTCVGNVHIESDVDVQTPNNGEEERKVSTEEKLNFSDSDSFLDSQPNFELSFFEAMEDQTKTSNGANGEQTISDLKVKPASTLTEDETCDKIETAMNTSAKPSLKLTDLNSYFEDSFIDNDLSDAVPFQSESKTLSPESASGTNNQSKGTLLNKPPLSIENSAVKRLSGKDDEFTFTQAMAVVHDSDDILQTSDSNSEGFSVEPTEDHAGKVTQSKSYSNETQDGGHRNVTSETEDNECGSDFTKLQTKSERTVASFSSSEEEEDLSALAQFDLGFELDDVIPPSPCVSQNQSQVTFSRYHSQSILKSRKSLATTYQMSKSQESKPSDSSQKEDQCLPEKENTDLQKELKSIKEDSENEIHSPQQNNFSFDLSEEFELSPVSSGKRSISPKYLPQEKEDCHQSPVKTASPEVSPCAISDRALVDSFSSDDEVVAVKRKRKAVILDSPSTPLTQKQVVDDDFETPAKPAVNLQAAPIIVNDEDFITPVKSSLKKPNFDSSGKKIMEKKDSKSKHGVSFALPPDFSDEDDFEVDVTALKKSVLSKCKSKRGQNHNVKSDSNSKARKSKSPLAAQFLEDEAEVSDEDDEYSGDEEEGSDLDRYDDSFIGDATQLSQRSADDMKAIYLKSVKSPPVRGRFKLSHRHYSRDVYSQPPPEEESQYLEDSFVVDEEEGEEDDGLMLDTSNDEVTMMDLSDYSCVGRRTRWSKPVKRTVTTKQKSKGDGSKRRRIKVMEDSSSEDDAKNLSFEAVDSAHVKRKPRKALLSSSSEGEVEVLPTKDETQNYGKENLTILRESAKQSSNQLSNQNVNSNVCRPNMKTSPSLNATMTNQKNSIQEQQRLERLQKQKEKQEEFRRRLAEKKALDTKEPEGVRGGRRSIVSSTGLIMDSSSSALNTDEKHVILVDSREINGCQDITSELRFKYGITVQTAQLGNCDYIVSNRMGVDRQQWSEFTNGSRKDKLVERVTALCDLFDKPALIIERDNVKADDKNSSKPLHWTKYVEKTLVHLLRSKVTLFFTDNQKDTARVLSEICRLEARKKAGIAAPTDLDDSSQAELRFYASIPGLSYINALNLCHNYKSIRGFIDSDTALIMTKGCLSKERASRIMDYLQRKFDPQMLPSGR
uniref:Fanconi anemia group M protein n=1 Tax=Magallana gigas TaxID=29159 RepID=A0A8W8I418_MAGGI|nr:Fanconi anemia group M protein [Crassostrea gigas]